MANIDSFLSITARVLRNKEFTGRRGAILYSELKSLRPGRYYLLGFNPGGHADDPDALTLDQDLTALARGRENAYLDQAWNNPELGLSPYQKRVKSLARILDVSLRDICSSNLIFMKSRRADGVKYPEDARACWPIHSCILEIVQPRVILSIGNGARSAYEFLRRGEVPAFVEIEDLEAYPSGYARWRLKACKGRMGTTKIKVIGLPHLSYYPLDLQKYIVIVQGWLSSLDVI